MITAVSEKTPQHPTQPSTVKAEAGYKFDKWTDNAGKSFNDDTALEQSLTLKIRLSQHTLQQQSRLIR